MTQHRGQLAIRACGDISAKHLATGCLYVYAWVYGHVDAGALSWLPHQTEGIGGVEGDARQEYPARGPLIQHLHEGMREGAALEVLAGLVGRDEGAAGQSRQPLIHDRDVGVRRQQELDDRPLLASRHGGCFRAANGLDVQRLDERVWEEFVMVGLRGVQQGFVLCRSIEASGSTSHKVRSERPRASDSDLDEDSDSGIPRPIWSSSVDNFDFGSHAVFEPRVVSRVQSTRIALKSQCARQPVPRSRTTLRSRTTPRSGPRLCRCGSCGRPQQVDTPHPHSPFEPFWRKAVFLRDARVGAEYPLVVVGQGPSREPLVAHPPIRAGCVGTRSVLVAVVWRARRAT